MNSFTYLPAIVTLAANRLLSPILGFWASCPFAYMTVFTTLQSDISESELRRYEKGLIQEPKSVYMYRLSLILEIDYEEILRHRWAKYPKKLERIGITP